MGERVIYQTIFNSISRFESSNEGRLRMSQTEMRFFVEREKDRLSERESVSSSYNSLLEGK